MGSITDTIQKRLTDKATGEAGKLLNKLANKPNNIKTISFPHNLENQAQSTYMMIYILDNKENSQSFSSTVFNSDVDGDSFEIPAITFLKNYEIKNS